MSAKGRRRKHYVNHSARRYWGMVSMVTILFCAVGLFVSLALAIHPDRNTPYHRVVERAGFQDAHTPTYLAESGLPPNSSFENPQQRSNEIRAISVYPYGVELRVAGDVVWNSGGVTVTTIQQLHELLNDPAWLQMTQPGEYVLKSALVVHEGVTMTIGEAGVESVLLQDSPGVLIGVTGGRLDFVDVTIATDVSSIETSDWYNPFVVAADGAVMNATDSRFTKLGWDWNASYGASWVNGSTGDVIRSTFDRNYIGGYTSHAEDMLFQSSYFTNNVLYGLDPHTFSKNLLIDNVTAERNQAHGIIFSDHVTDSVIQNSTSRYNGENGIMLDEQSTNNRVSDNVVASNEGDGLVTADSPDNTFTGNTVEDNRVGIRIDPADSDRTIARENTIIANDRASENIQLNESNVLSENGGQVNWEVLARIWIAVAIATVVFALVLARYSRDGLLRRM